MCLGCHDACLRCIRQNCMSPFKAEHLNPACSTYAMHLMSWINRISNVLLTCDELEEGAPISIDSCSMNLRAQRCRSWARHRWGLQHKQTEGHNLTCNNICTLSLYLSSVKYSDIKLSLDGFPYHSRSCKHPQQLDVVTLKFIPL